MNTSFLASNHSKTFTDLIIGESTRMGGVSPAPYNSLNLGLYSEDSSANVQENRYRFFKEVGIDPNRVAGAMQIHLDRIAVVKHPGQYRGVDALITDRPNIFLTVTVADCCPVLVYDTRTGACGAAHAGWRGTVARITAKMIEAMTDHYGTKAHECVAFIGTSISAQAFEVDADVAALFDDSLQTWDEQRGKFLVDVKKANLQQLTDYGLLAQNIETSPYCTSEHNQFFFSHRKEKGQTGRSLAIIGHR